MIPHMGLGAEEKPDEPRRRWHRYWLALSIAAALYLALVVICAIVSANLGVNPIPAPG